MFKLLDGKEYIDLISKNAFKQALEHAEREIFLRAYHHAKYNQVVTAKLLGVSRGTLRTRLKQWDG